MRLFRATIVPAWFIGFGLLTLSWSPMTLSGIVLLIAGMAAPAVVMLLWRFLAAQRAHQ